MPRFATERGRDQFAWLKRTRPNARRPRKEVKEPLVPCDVSFPLFPLCPKNASACAMGFWDRAHTCERSESDFPLVERKEVVEDRTRSQHGREFVSVSAEDNPSVTACTVTPPFFMRPQNTSRRR